MESWDVYDIHRIPTNKQMKRGAAFEQGAYHLVVHICLFNQQGEMLIQKRHANKDTWPNWWDFTVGGSALAGETSQQAAEREVAEEIGFSIQLANQRPAFTLNFEYGFDDYYLQEVDLDIDSLVFPTEEVQEVCWATKTEILQLIKRGKFLNYHESLIELLFAMKNNYGAFK